MKITRNGATLYDDTLRDTKGRFTRSTLRKACKRFIPLTALLLGISAVMLFGEYTVTRFKVFQPSIASAEVRELSKEELIIKYESLLEDQQEKIGDILEGIRNDKLSFK